MIPTPKGNSQTASDTASPPKKRAHPFGNPNIPPMKRTSGVPAPERQTRLPVSRIKTIMRYDPDVNIITQEAAYLVAKAAEYFVELFAKKAHDITIKQKRRTL